MKARTKKTRWLLIALLFGLLAAGGLTFMRHHGVRPITAGHEAAAPQQPALPHVALLAANNGTRAPVYPAGAAADSNDEVVVGTDSNSQPPHQSGHSDAQSDTSTGGGIGVSNQVAGPAGASNGGSQSQSNQPSTSATGNAPQSVGNVLAYNGYAPLDCELPAGCGANGANGGTGHVTRQPSGTSGGAPFARDSQGGQTDDGSPPPNNSTNPQTNQTNDTGQGQDPPGGTDPPGGGSKPPVASAPELDPATLAGAVTLLLGSLAVLHRRRARVTR